MFSQNAKNVLLRTSWNPCHYCIDFWDVPPLSNIFIDIHFQYFLISYMLLHLTQQFQPKKFYHRKDKVGRLKRLGLSIFAYQYINQMLLSQAFHLSLHPSNQIKKPQFKCIFYRIFPMTYDKTIWHINKTFLSLTKLFWGYIFP